MAGMDLLRLDELVSLGMEEKDGILYVDADVVDVIAPTCDCGGSDVVKHGRRTVHFRDHPIQRQETYLRINRQRYRCRNCGSTLLQKLADIDDKRRMTTRFRDRIAKDGIAHKFTVGGDINGVKESLARRVFKEHAKARLENYTFELPRVLGIDEKYLGKIPRCVIGDVENRLLLDIIETRKMADLEKYFERFHFLDRAKVEVVTQDMHKPYRALSHKYFKRATVVIDRFHVVRYADWAVSEVRKRVQSVATDEERLDLKRNIKVLAKRQAKLTAEEKIEVQRIFRLHPVIEEAVTLKEWFYKIYYCETREEAENDYDAWARLVPDYLRFAFGPIFSFMRHKKWRKEVFNYFDARYTNGYVEAVNGLLDEISRAGRGYDLETLRAKALLKYGNVMPLGDKVAFDWMGLTEEERARILSTNVGHGVDLSTFERDWREGFGW